MAEITSLWRSLIAVLEELKAKVDPIFHKDVDEITATASAVKKKAEEVASGAVAEEKPVVEEAVKATEAVVAEEKPVIEEAVKATVQTAETAEKAVAEPEAA